MLNEGKLVKNVETDGFPSNPICALIEQNHSVTSMSDGNFGVVKCVDVFVM